MTYSLGSDDLDKRIAELVDDACDNPGDDLIGELITTALKLHRDNPNRGDLKLINTALKEMRYSDVVFAHHDDPKVCIFGSARLNEDNPNYQLAVDFAAGIAKEDWSVITGAGPGIMEAGNRGAGRENSFGVSIRLPFESSSNDYLAPERTVNFKYFFTRKLAFVKESNAFAIFPGGFGTLDEFFELLTLVQTGKTDLAPIVLLEAPGTDYWGPVLHDIAKVLSAKGLISVEDVHLYNLHTEADGAVAEILNFYANYHSQRFVNGELVLRMLTAPDDQMLADLNDEFGDIVASGQIKRIDATPAEVADHDAVDLDRLRMRFDRRSFGRLRQVVDRLNTIVSDTDRIQPPGHLSEEQAERPW